MTTETASAGVPPIHPKRLSGHKLVEYLISNPDARGDFKWHSLLSCMWRNLLLAQPSFEWVADFGKINHRDAIKILEAQPQLAHRFDWKTFWQDECLTLLCKYPELATPERTAHLKGYTWSELLKKQPGLAPLCDFKKKFCNWDWINLIRRQTSFAEMCPWSTFSFYEWLSLLKGKKDYLRFLKMEYITSAQELYSTLCCCYFGEHQSYKGAFAQGVQDAATFLICKRMDRVNGKRYLKMQCWHEYWSLVEEVGEIDPEEALDVYGKKLFPFYMVLAAPDTVFEKLLPYFDLTMRDPGGNSLLLAALIRGIVSTSMERYELLLEKGLDPDEKNLAGFSCNELKEYLKDKKIAKKGRKYVR